MTTLGTMKTRIANEMVNESITSAEIEAAIRTGIAYYETEEFWFNQFRDTFSTVAAQEWYGEADSAVIPNIIAIKSFQIGAATSKKSVKSVDNEFLDDEQDGSMTGEPTHYSRFGEELRLYPIPSDVYTARISGVKRLDALSEDMDSNAWTDRCEALIRSAAKRILYADTLHDEEKASTYAAMEQAELQRIRDENRRRSPQKELRVNWPFNGFARNLETNV